MTYKTKNGVVLFSICGSWFLFPSREAKGTIPMLISLSENIRRMILLDSNEEMGQFLYDRLNDEEKRKLERLVKMNYLEEIQI